MFNLPLTDDDFNDIIYAAREAQIRFMRLRTQVRAGDPSAHHWSEDECDDKIAHYLKLEAELARSYKSITGNDWY